MCRSLATIASYMLDPCAEQKLLPHEFELLKQMRSIADLPASAQTNETATTPAPDASLQCDIGLVRYAVKVFDDWYDKFNGSKCEDLSCADIARWICNRSKPEWGWNQATVSTQVRRVAPRCVKKNASRPSKAEETIRRDFCNLAPRPFD